MLERALGVNPASSSRACYAMLQCHPQQVSVACPLSGHRRVAIKMDHPQSNLRKNNLYNWGFSNLSDLQNSFSKDFDISHMGECVRTCMFVRVCISLFLGTRVCQVHVYLCVHVRTSEDTLGYYYSSAVHLKHLIFIV